MSITQLYNDYSIHYETERHKHTRPGWVNTPCPFCTGNPGLHLGCRIDMFHFYCWRCGWKPADKVIAVLCSVTKAQAEELIEEYGGGSIYTPVPTVKIGTKKFQFPSNTQPLTQKHKNYLADRNFDPDIIERDWNVCSTGPVAMLDKIDYSHGILIPIYDSGKPVSFQCRIVNKTKAEKYLACTKTREIIHHKDLLYGKPNNYDTLLVVEGVTDVWRLGDIAKATFGVEYSLNQLRFIAKWYKRTFVLYDPDEAGTNHAEKLISELHFRGREAYMETLDKDPGDMNQKDADYLVNYLVRRIT